MIMMKTHFSSFILLSVIICSTLAAIKEHEITNLPGLTSSISFKQYAGYITVDQQSGRSLFYWFVESQGNPSKDPLLIWMNGGPGASSLMGFMTEHGPFRPNADGKTLFLNPWAWNRNANMIYLEAPAGVGFSYSNNTNDYTTDDTKTAHDNYIFLLNWFEGYSEFKSNDFYVTGESYGGHYVPQLSNLILTKSNSINMKGLMVGNPGTNNDWYFAPDEYAFSTMMYTHALLPQTQYAALSSACGWSDFLTTCQTNFSNPSSACRQTWNDVSKYLPSFNDIDPYDLYAPVCTNQSSVSALRYVSHWNKHINRWASKEGGITFAPCIWEFTTNYLNQPAVQKALHVRPTNWAIIGNINYGSETEDIIPLYQNFFKAAPHWRIFVYSGDTDASVPFMGTQQWIECLGRPVQKDWSNWRYQSTIGGSFKVFSGITFLTVRGCGHMTPWYCPEQSYAFYSKWITNQPF